MVMNIHHTGAVLLLVIATGGCGGGPGGGGGARMTWDGNRSGPPLRSPTIQVRQHAGHPRRQRQRDLVGERFAGLIDEIMLYQRALSAAEIAQFHESAIFL